MIGRVARPSVSHLVLVASRMACAADPRPPCHCAVSVENTFETDLQALPTLGFASGPTAMGCHPKECAKHCFPLNLQRFDL